MKFTWCLIIFLLITISVGNLQAQESCAENSAKILILGVYHFDNPGQDTYSTESDDVYSPKRQGEIKELVEKLTRYRPSKIAIESAYKSDYWTSRYKTFLDKDYELGRNEIEQIGFRLAKKFNHETLYPIDFPMWMNGLMPNEREQPKIKPTPIPKPEKETTPKTESEKPAYIQKKEEIIRTKTIVESLRYLNSDEYMKPSHAQYLTLLLPSETIAIYEKTDLATNWYKRNLRMFTNISRITDFPDDRILLIVGSGHLKILRGFAEDSTYFCLVDTQDYLK
jgi:hypothetical protein